MDDVLVVITPDLHDERLGLCSKESSLYSRVLRSAQLYTPMKNQKSAGRNPWGGGRELVP